MTVWAHRCLMDIFMLHTVPSSSSSYIYINFTVLSCVVFDRFPQLRFDYTDPEKNFDRRRVHGLVCKLVQVKDTANATALEVTAGGKVSLRILEVGYCWFMWFVNVRLLGWLVFWIWLCVNRTQGTHIPHTHSNVHGILPVLVEFMSLVFTRMFYERQLRSLLLLISTTG